MQGGLTSEQAPAATTPITTASTPTPAPTAPAALSVEQQRSFDTRKAAALKAFEKESGAELSQMLQQNLRGGFGGDPREANRFRRERERAIASFGETFAADEAGRISAAGDLNAELGLDGLQRNVPGGELPGGNELSGFDPSQNVTDTTQEGLVNLENAARGNTVRDLTDLLGAQFEDLGPLLQAEAERRGEAEISADTFAEILRGSLGSSSEASPEQLERINTIAEENIARSGSDLDASLQRGLQQLREESGASRGLRFTDTPIFNEAQQSVNEAQRLQAQSISTARGAQASAELNLPLALQQLEFQRAGLAQNAQSFEQQLAQQAFANRTLLLGNTQGFGLDLLGSTPSANEIKFGSDRLAFEKSEGRKNRQSAQDDRKLGIIGGVAGLFG